jgi:ATP-binding protein involved in chromosome partitioning
MDAQRDEPAATPTSIRQEGPRELSITWADGRVSVYDVRELRLACACASCVDEWTGEHRLDPASVPEDVRPRSVQGVGRYAIQIDWSDGHSTGIYPFRRLRELAARGSGRQPR